jgi:NADH:ubiquinone oxidoreductase subunit 3 (subunit A)
MNHKVFFGIAIRIVILFVIAMFGTFLPEHLREFFGDKKCQQEEQRLVSDKDGIYKYETYYDTECGEVDSDWEWGARHYWYYWMMFILFILSCINLVIGIIELLIKNYPQLNQ